MYAVLVFILVPRLIDTHGSGLITPSSHGHTPWRESHSLRVNSFCKPFLTRATQSICFGTPRENSIIISTCRKVVLIHVCQLVARRLRCPVLLTTITLWRLLAITTPLALLWWLQNMSVPSSELRSTRNTYVAALLIARLSLRRVAALLWVALSLSLWGLYNCQFQHTR